MDSLFKPIGELTYEQLQKQKRLLQNLLIDTDDRMKQLEGQEDFEWDLLDLNS